MIRILVVDDEPSICEFFEIFLSKEGFDVTTTTKSLAAYSMMKEDTYDVLVSDIRMPEMTGLELLEKTRSLSPVPLVILITAYASIESAISALKHGAYDYIIKPFQIDDILHVIRKAVEKLGLERENAYFKRRQAQASDLSEIVGNSAKIEAVREQIRSARESKSNVLITGESGTGKELVARAIHFGSQQKHAAFVTVNCAALPENLIESELFGYVKGAFTGANTHKKGLFDVADKGTLFLDEIGELPVSMQAKLLRALQEKSFRRVGSLQDTKIDIRFIAATNRDLAQEIAHGRFREDLFYRLNVLAVQVPPLRQRRGDIPALVQHVLEKCARESGKKLLPVAEDAMTALQQYEFRGNVRELENIIERSLAVERGSEISLPSLGFPASARVTSALGTGETADAVLPDPATVELPAEGMDLEGLLETLERAYLAKALERSGGAKQEAARLLGLSFRSFRYRLTKHNFEGAEDS